MLPECGYWGQVLGAGQGDQEQVVTRTLGTGRVQTLDKCRYLVASYLLGPHLPPITLHWSAQQPIGFKSQFRKELHPTEVDEHEQCH